MSEDVVGGRGQAPRRSLELVDGTGRFTTQGKAGSIPGRLPPILQRLDMDPEKHLASVRKSQSGFTNALGELDKLKEFARHFDKRFLRGQTSAAALFSPGR